jgi:hypothetical protein
MSDHSSLSRRELIALAASIPAAVPLVEYVRASAEDARALDGALLFALAEAVLPTELGADFVRRAATRFDAWTRGYVAGAELDHGYGSADLMHAAANPSPKWATQLAALDRDARSRNGRGFAAIGIAERQALVRAAVDAAQKAARVTRAPSANDIASGKIPATAQSLPAVVEAPHVAVALLAHFYESSEANDLCYGASIGKQTCRPLGAQHAKPVPLARAGRRA